MALDSGQLDSVDSTISLEWRVVMNRARAVLSLITPSKKYTFDSHLKMTELLPKEELPKTDFGSHFF